MSLFNSHKRSANLAGEDEHSALVDFQIRGEADDAALELVSTIAQPPAESRRAAERPANRAFYAMAHEPKEIWEVPGSGHIGGTEAQPQEYERRVTAFFARELRPLR
jgi:hypothetical protein